VAEEDPPTPSPAPPASGAGSTATANRWPDPQARQQWVDQRYADAENTKPVNSTKDWAIYQRRTTGDVEVRVGEGRQAIWADGLQVDPDAAVVAEAKYVVTSRHSLYEGNVPPALLDTLLTRFDEEIRRYGAAIKDQRNPISRLRIFTNTAAAAKFLGNRTRSILGPNIDVDVRHTP